MVLCAQADQQLQREDTASESRLRLAERLYAQASALLAGWDEPTGVDVTGAEMAVRDDAAGADVTERAAAPVHTSPARSPASLAADGGETLDRLRAQLLQQRAQTLEQMYALARREPAPSEQHLRRRWTYLLIAATGLIALGLFLRDALDLGDVALGKHWTASSYYGNLRPRTGRLHRESQHFFFHTRGDQEGWLEIDLDRPTRLASAKIVNRDDCCQMRALPLVIEASTDHRQWHELARTYHRFDVWRTSFAAVTARWVRLRVLRPSALHLKQVVLRS
jgi:hypothetical protein